MFGGFREPLLIVMEERGTSVIHKFAISLMRNSKVIAINCRRAAHRKQNDLMFMDKWVLIYGKDHCTMRVGCNHRHRGVLKMVSSLLE